MSTSSISPSTRKGPSLRTVILVGGIQSPEQFEKMRTPLSFAAWRVFQASFFDRAQMPA
jgi:hypothetical protein